MQHFGVTAPAPMIIITEANTAYMLSIDGQEVVKLAEQVESYAASDVLIVLVTPDQFILYDRWSGNRYNFERSLDVDCKINNCVAFTRNGVFLGLQTEIDGFLLCDFPRAYPETIAIDSSTNTPSPCGYGLRYFTGQGFQFSEDSDALTVWENSEIVIYTGLTGLFSPDNGLEETKRQIINLVSPLYSERWFMGRGIWSADGRWLAYTDAQGLWMWDVYTQEPELLIPASEDSIATARHFSPSGRYLAISDTERHYILDLRSGLEFPDGVISPDERQLIAVDTVEGKPISSERCDLRTGECTSLCNWDGGEQKEGVTYTAIWHESQFGYPPITNRIQNDCAVSLAEVTTFPKYIFLDEYYWGILTSGYEIQFPYLLREHNLEGLIDAPIRDIEFLPAIYFEQNPIS